LRRFARLHKPFDHLGAGAGGQFGKLVERFGGVRRAAPGGFAFALPFESDENGAFAARLQRRRV
jgi:hypothetical protein